MIAGMLAGTFLISAGFIAGALVYRNNTERLEGIIIKLEAALKNK